jgi:intein/homing endonuclease
VSEQSDVFAKLFSGRHDVYGTYDDRGPRQVKEPVTPELYIAHLEGKKSLGIYMLLDDGSCNFAAVDIDEKNFEQAKSIRQACFELDIPVYIAESKSKGYHCYLFGDHMIARDIRYILLTLLERLKIKAEVFPKQDKLDEVIKYGNYINLPCFGTTRQFQTGDQQPVATEHALKLIKLIDADTIVKAKAKLPPEPPPLIPQKPDSRSKKGKKHPPCIDAILKGVAQGCRDEAAFALARHFLDQGFTPEEVFDNLMRWDLNNKPPIADQRILQTKIESAKHGYAFGCASIQNEPLLAQHCPGESHCLYLREANEVKKKEGLLKEISFREIDACLYEEIITNPTNPSKAEANFVCYNTKDQSFSIVKDAQEGEIKYVPIYADEIQYSAVTFPTGVTEYGSTEDLIKEIVKHVGTYADLPPMFREWTAWYILMSWIYDRLPAVSYLRFLGDWGTGKSRSLDVIGDLCYKRMKISGAITPAPIYRLLKKYEGTLIIDEADMEKSDESQFIIKILNCLLPGTPILTSTGFLSIEKNMEDVLTHLGNLKSVKEKMSRRYDGKIVTILPKKTNIPISVTTDHGIWALKTNQCPYTKRHCTPVCTHRNRRNKCAHSGLSENYTPEWIEAGALTENMALAIPKPKLILKDTSLAINLKLPFGMHKGRKWVKRSFPVTNDFAKLIGYYLAEGCYSKSQNALIFTLGTHEQPKIAEITRLLQEIFGATPTTQVQGTATHIHVFNPGFKIFDELFGDGASNKKLPVELLALPDDKIVSLLKGLFAGDGYFLKRESSLAYSTVSDALSGQVYLMLMRLGILPSVYKRKGSSTIQGRKVNARQRWVIRIGKADIDRFEIPGKASMRTFKHYWSDDQWFYVPIANIKTSDYSGPVYNCNVEDDHSYSSIMITPKNCGIERGRPIMRCVKDDPDFLQTMAVFGPKCFATRKRFDDQALESRCLTTIMEETDRKDLPPFMAKECNEVKRDLLNKLLLFRFRNLGRIPKEISEKTDIDLGDIDGRLKQVCIPFAMVFKDLPETLDKFRTFLQGYQAELRGERSESYHGRIVYALFKAFKQMGKDKTTAAAVAAIAKEDLNLDLSARKIAAILKTMKIDIDKPRRVGDKTFRFIIWDLALMRKIYRRYQSGEPEFLDLLGYETQSVPASNIQEEMPEQFK